MRMSLCDEKRRRRLVRGCFRRLYRLLGCRVAFNDERGRLGSLIDSARIRLTDLLSACRISCNGEGFAAGWRLAAEGFSTLTRAGQRKGGLIMLTGAKHRGCWLALVAAIATAAPALAGHHSRDKADADVDSVKASMYVSTSGWRVELQYKVEIEDAPPARFEVLVTFSEKGRLLCDREGRLVEIADVLNHATDIDDDKIKFEQVLFITLPREMVYRPDHLKVRVEIVDRQTGRIVDDKSKSVKLKKYRRRECSF